MLLADHHAEAENIRKTISAESPRNHSIMHKFWNSFNINFGIVSA
jgi:hypothetical protein